MRKIDVNVVRNIFVAYVENEENEFARFYVQESETLKDFAMQVFEELKTENENCKSIDIYPYGNPEAHAILEYYKDDEEGDDFWVVEN